MSPRHAERRLAAALLVAVFVSFEWPVLLHPLSSAWGVPGGDFGQTLWNFWVAAKEIGAGRSPWTTELLFAGRTTSLFYHTLNLFYFLAAAPVYLLTRSELAAFNVSHLAAGALGLACFLSPRTRPRRAAHDGRSRRRVFRLFALLPATPHDPEHPEHLADRALRAVPSAALAPGATARRRGRGALRRRVSSRVVALPDLQRHGHAVSRRLVRRGSQRGVPLLDKAARAPRSSRLRCRVARPRALCPVSPSPTAPSPPSRTSPTPSASAVPPRRSTIWCRAGSNKAWMGWIEPYRRPEVFAYRIGREHTLFLGVVAILLIARRLADPAIAPPARSRPGRRAGLLRPQPRSGAHPIRARHVWRRPHDSPLPGNWLHLLPVFSSIRHVTRFGVMVLFFSAIGRCNAGRTAAQAPLAFADPMARPRRRPRSARRPCGRHAAFREGDIRPGVRRPTCAARSPIPPSRRAPAMILPAFEWQSEGLGMYLQTMHHRTLVAGYLSRDPEAEITCTQTVRLFVEQIVGLNARRLGPADLTPIPRARPLRPSSSSTVAAWASLQAASNASSRNNSTTAAPFAIRGWWSWCVAVEFAVATGLRGARRQGIFGDIWSRGALKRPDNQRSPDQQKGYRMRYPIFVRGGGLWRNQWKRMRRVAPARAKCSRSLIASSWRGTESAVQVAAYLNGERIVDAWAAPEGMTVDGESLFPIFSTGKGIAATAVHRLVERGVLSWDDPIAKHWPEFAAEGKEGIHAASCAEPHGRSADDARRRRCGRMRRLGSHVRISRRRRAAACAGRAAALPCDHLFLAGGRNGPSR